MARYVTTSSPVVRGKREAILAKRRDSSLGVMGQWRRMVRAPRMIWQVVPGVVEVHVSEGEVQV